MDEKKDFIEQILGGIFGLIAVCAAISEMLINGVNAASIAGCIKDVFGTLAIIILFFAIIKDRIPKSKFNDILADAISKWQEENSNMIIRNPQTDIEHKGAEPSCYSLQLKTNVKEFYQPTSTTEKCGLFFRMPILKRENYSNKNVTIRFYLNKGTFFNDIPNENIGDGYEKLIVLFSDLVNTKHGDFASASGKGQEITVVFKKPIKSNSDINQLVEVINTMYTAYLVSARITVEKK